MWGPHPDRWIASLEQDYYRPGFTFLSEFYGAAFGVKAPRELRKAFGSGLPDWGTIAGLFQRKDLGPMQMRDAWGQVIDRLVHGLFNQRTQDEMAAAVAVKCHWLGRVRTLTEGIGNPTQGYPTWHEAEGKMRPAEVKAMEWTRARALEGARRLETGAKQGLMNVLLQARQEGLGTRDLSRRCYDRFADLNRDWRRLALTETAAAVENGKLAAVPEGEAWEAVWVSCARGCHHCQDWNGKTFRVVSPDARVKDGQTMVWTGKTNIGRSSAPTTRDGRKRGPSELWWPCVPCHPNCGCQFVMRRRKAA